MLLDFLQHATADDVNPLARHTDVPRDRCLTVSVKENFLRNAVRFRGKLKPPGCFHKDTTRHLPASRRHCFVNIAHILAN